MTEPTWMKGRPRRILLATDLSARCDRALDRAALLASTWQAELVALHVLEPVDDFYASSEERCLPSWRRPPDAARIAEQQLRDDMAKADAKVSVMVEKGEPADVILGTVQKEGCDLIVTGIARDETLGRFGLGNTVDRLVRRSKVPVLIVKKRVRSDYENIIIATDLSESSRHAAEAALRFFPQNHMSLFHAYEAPFSGMMSDSARDEEEQRRIAAGDCAGFAVMLDMPAERRRGLGILVECGEPDRLIRDYARDKGVDLVVLGTHGRSGLLDILIGSTARKILASLSCDALVVREPRAAVEREVPS